MSEPTQASAPSRGKGRKILGMSQGQLLIVLAVALVGGGYLLWRHRKSAQQAQQQATSACPDGSAPDANGNCVQSGQDWSGAISTLQTEIADLQGAMAGAGGAGGGSGTVGGSTGTSTVPPAGTSPPSITPPGTNGGGKGWTPAGPISNLRVTGYSRTGVSFAWNPASGATQGYAWGVSGQGITKKGNTSATHVSVTGLTKPGVYNFGIQALPGGPGNNIHTPPLKGT